MSNLVLFLCALPLISVIGYMLSRPALFEAGLTLIASVFITSGMIYLRVYQDALFPSIEPAPKAIFGKVMIIDDVLHVSGNICISD